jgi:MFS family permease
MRRWLILSVVLLCATVPALAFGQGVDSAGVVQKSRPSFRDYALESAAGLATGFAMVIPLSLLTYFVSSGDGQGSGVAAGIVGGASAAAFLFGCPVGANWAGNARGWSGSFGRSLGLALIPPAAALGILYLSSEASSDALMAAGVAVAVVGTPVMASVGYNIRATRGEPRSWENRLAPPSFAARAVDSPEPGERREMALDARLLTVRF